MTDKDTTLPSVHLDGGIDDSSKDTYSEVDRLGDEISKKKAELRLAERELRELKKRKMKIVEKAKVLGLIANEVTPYKIGRGDLSQFDSSLKGLLDYLANIRYQELLEEENFLNDKISVLKATIQQFVGQLEIEFADATQKDGFNVWSGDERGKWEFWYGNDDGDDDGGYDDGDDYDERYLDSDPQGDEGNPDPRFVYGEAAWDDPDEEPDE